MKIYVDEKGDAPSPRRVRIYLAEKGLAVPYVKLRIHEENRTPEFRAKNPIGSLPVLELDDGTCISESISICRYFEALHPEPSLFGRSPLEQAWVDMWMRRAELYLYLSIDLSSEGFLPAEAGSVFRNYAELSLRFLDRELAEREFIAGPDYTIADVFALSAVDFGIASNGYEIAPDQPHLARWHGTVSARPSASA
jgi:glutathione S-transferase